MRNNIKQLYHSSSIIPGINVAEAVVWATMVTMLATINFTKARDSEGREITPKVEHVGEGLVRYAHIAFVAMEALELRKPQLD